MGPLFVLVLRTGEISPNVASFTALTLLDLESNRLQGKSAFAKAF